MARKYATVDPNIWNQTEFRRLSDDAQRLFFYTTTSPNSEANAYVMPALTLCEDLRMDIGRVDRAFKSLAAKPFVLYDGTARVVYIADYWLDGRNKIPNGNVAAYIARHLYNLPTSPLKARAISDLQATGWFSERVAPILANWRYTPVAGEIGDDPRQGSLLSADQRPALPPPAAKPPKREATKLAADWTPSEKNLAYASANGIDGAELDYQVKNFRRYWSTEGKPMKDWDATWENAVDRATKRLAERGGHNGSNGSGNGSAATLAPDNGPDWAERMRLWRTPKRIWLGPWGPKPGEPHCEVPPKFLEQPPE